MLLTRSLLASISIVVASAAAAAVPNADQPQCYPGVYMIVARGTSEPPGEGTSQQVADKVVAQIPGSASVPLDYPAAPTFAYFASLSQGAITLINEIIQYVDACGESARIALIGFSQGGQVITTALAGPTSPLPIDPNYGKHGTYKLNLLW